MVDKKNALKNRKTKTSIRDVVIDEDLTVTVRAVSREEVKTCKTKSNKDDEKTNENKLISIALVDPAMTEEDVAEWMTDAPAGDSVKVLDAIAELSGMTKEYTKSAISRTGRQRK